MTLMGFAPDMAMFFIARVRSATCINHAGIGDKLLVG